MLVKVIKEEEQTIIHKEVFFVDAEDKTAAVEFVQAYPWLRGAKLTVTAQPKHRIFGTDANFEGYAKLLIETASGSFTAYSPSLDIEHVTQAVLEQNPDILDLTINLEFGIAAVQIGHSYHSGTVTVLGQPTVDHDEAKLHGICEFLDRLHFDNDD
ncbi:hypothetical protein [Paraburkholderia aromaticivorans]|uniref:hypothetical protein n=1 Tax=Paraburkholderia aromaticivorans TaxID=2026199 RepID=UPI0038B7A0BA